jgi:hypothetical protein
MLHTTVTARARRTRCAHAQLAPTDFSDTCLSAHCLRPPPGRTHSPPTVALALLERSQRLPKPPTPPLPRPRRDPPAADRALPPQQRCALQPSGGDAAPPTQTTPPQRAQYACCGGVMHAAVLAVPKLLLPPVHPLHSTAPHCTQAHSPTAATAAPTSPFAAFLAKRGKITHTWTTREALRRWIKASATAGDCSSSTRKAAAKSTPVQHRWLLRSRTRRCQCHRRAHRW